MIDYEKEYKEMVQRVKELHESGSPLTKRQMEIICPGLAESEDERIRLWVKTHLQLIDSPDDLEDYKKAFDWLERQKEPKPAKWESGDWNMRNNILVRLEALRDVETQRTAKTYIKNEIAWLRSIGPCEKHWRPRKQQIDALEYIVRLYSSDGALDSLLDELKQL